MSSVFDDVTRLIAAQRSAAWGEVARRLAHEIKNPLTPIQLSAERLQMKLADKLANGDADIAQSRHADHHQSGAVDEAHGRRLPRLRPPACAGGGCRLISTT
jgi:signal transduction histidine kinase